MNVSEFVFRHAGACLIEAPDLAGPPMDAVERWQWTATVWPDPQPADGWSFLEWPPGERGWKIPITVTLGDIVEFGVGWVTVDGRRGCTRWWGWIERISSRALVIIGPYDHPARAEADARSTIDEIRLSQLAEPDIVEATSSTLGGIVGLD